MIKSEQLLPLMKKGWVTMDYDGEWWCFESEPKSGKDCWMSQSGTISNLSTIFDIEPVEDWTKSLMRCGDE